MALEQFKQLSKINPGIAEDWKISGMIYDYLGNANEATLCYNKCIELYNEQLESTDHNWKVYSAQLNKAMVLLLNNKEKEGRILFEQLKVKYPNDTNINHLINRNKQDFFKRFI